MFSGMEVKNRKEGGSIIHNRGRGNKFKGNTGDGNVS